MKERKISRIVQDTVKILILLLATYFAVMHQMKGVLVAPNAHVFCPFGGLETLYKFVAEGGYIKKIMPATMVVFFASVALAILLNRAFCGWICPLGTLQTIFDRIGRFFKIKKLRVPQNVEMGLSWLKYGILAAALYFTWRAGELVYAAYDPWSAYTHIAAGFEELYSEMLIGSIFLLVALIGSLWLPSNFCRYFCPMGAFLSFFSKFSPTKIYRNETSCINCKKCDRVCPAQIEISTTPAVSSAQCLSCGDCVETCPVADTLYYSVQNKWKMTWLVYGIVTVVIFFAPVLVAKQLGIWKTNFSSAAEVLVDDSGKKNPANIKGSMPLDVIAKEFEIPVDAFFKRFNLPEGTNPGDMVKNIVHPLDLETEDIRAFILEYQEKGEAAISAPEASEPAPGEVSPTPGQAESHAKPETASTLDIRGRTTMDELREFGLTKEQFKEITGVEMPDEADLKIKDFAEENGLDRETIKDKFIEVLQQ